MELRLGRRCAGFQSVATGRLGLPCQRRGERLCRNDLILQPLQLRRFLLQAHFGVAYRQAGAAHLFTQGHQCIIGRGEDFGRRRKGFSDGLGGSDGRHVKSWNKQGKLRI